jgi:hypothetical protein
MVISCVIKGFLVHNVLVDTGSAVDIIFAKAFRQMQEPEDKIHDATHPLWFRRKTNCSAWCRCFGSDRTPGDAPQGVFRSRTVSTTVAKWFMPDARGIVDNVCRFGPLRDA